jgi:hypothetical protein
MEIYRNDANPLVAVEVPAAVKATVTAIDVFAFENGRKIHEFNAVAATPTGYTVLLPWSLSRQDRDLVVKWEITYTDAGVPTVATDQTAVSIITPLLPLEEVARIAGYDLTTAEGRTDTLDLERRVRYAVQTHTGQNFGKFAGVMQVSGNGSNKLNLPAPLLEFRGFSFDNIVRSNHSVKLINNGWALASGNVYIDNIKQAPPEWMLDRFDYTGKIYAPMLYGHHRFNDGVEYTIEGTWGYNDVPGDVKQAARLLVQDYSCDESLWRERYIDSVRAGDWRFEFNAAAFAGTGNVQADQILSGYRRATMVVV